MSALPVHNRPPSALAATLSHARYVIAGDPVTAFAFGLLALLIFAAVFGVLLLTGTTIRELPEALYSMFSTRYGRRYAEYYDHDGEDYGDISDV